ncbi:unnamed protein product, partial [Ectocarpus sp. 12 AP-2014]
NQPRQLPKFTADDASRTTWLQCKETDFGPGTLPGREISRVRHACVAQPAEADWRQEVPTLCYFRLPDPTGKTNGDSIQKIHYVHGDGSKSVDSTAPCAGCDRADVVLNDVTRVGKPQYFYSTRCAYTKRADINIDVQELSEIKRLER